MATFTDNKQREWEVRIDAPAIMRIRADCDPKFLFHDSPEDNTFTRLRSDPVLLCRVIYLLCDKQRQERGITEEDFYLHVIGNAIDSATEAMLAAIIFFTPKADRTLLEAGVRRQQAMHDKIVSLAMKRLDDPAIEAAMLTHVEQILDARLGVTLPKSVIATRESSESPPPD